MGAIALAAAGVALGAGGAYLGGRSADKKRDELSQATGQWLPNIGQNQSNYFNDLNAFLPQSQDLARRVGQGNLDQALGLREQLFPGIGQGTQDAAKAIFPLLRGELPQGVMDAFSRAGGASTVGSGFGGSGFGFLNTGLFGARGALGGMQTGMGLLQSLLSTAPQVQIPTSMDFLSNILTPGQRTNTDLSIRGQNLGIASQLAQMDTSNDKWAQFMSSTGGTLTGLGTMGALGGFNTGGAGVGGGVGGAMMSPYSSPQASPGWSFGLS